MITNKLKLKWNWGTGIALVYTTFALVIIGFVVHSFRKRIDLVTPDYYAKELVFQKQIDRETRTRNLANPLQWESAPDAVSFQFPTAMQGQKLEAEVQFFSPVDSRNDLMVKVAGDAFGKAVAQTTALNRGRYIMKVYWSANGTEYYNEGTFVKP